MPDRDAQIRAFLARAGWAGAEAAVLAGDLSTRRYLRLARTGETAVLMDAANDPSTPRFAEITAWLRAAGASAPEILADDAPNGLLLLEDLGDARLSLLLTGDPGLRESVYEDALDLLIRFRLSLPPPGLPRPASTELAASTTLADDHWPGADRDRLSRFRAGLETILARVLADAVSVSLRDLHSDNLIWLPERSGFRRLGLLDYQDAFLTHPAYDLVSLLTDARTPVSAGLRQSLIARYTTLSGDDPSAFRLAFAALSAQRNLRILGIFARAQRAGRTGYDIPRVRAYLAEALCHPALAPLRDDCLGALPESAFA